MKRLMSTTFLGLMLAFALAACSNPICDACKESCDTNFPSDKTAADACKTSCENGDACK
jgi:hypothetical protein